MRILYSLLFYLFIPFELLRLLWRSRKAKAYRSRWRERFAFFSVLKKFQQGVWVHAVSVGETVAAAPLIKALQSKYSKMPIVVTTTTPTGSVRVQKLLGDSVFHVYKPYDLPCLTKRFLKKIKPQLVIIMETELWPNLLYYCEKKNIPVMLANARLSERSARGYAHFKKLTVNMLKSLTAIAVQAEADAARFKKLGASNDRVHVTGNIKFDVACPPSVVETGELLRQQLGAHRRIWIAASTHEGEDEKILRAFAQVKTQLSDSLLILVPRHPERFKKVAELCRKKNYQTVLRSTGKACLPQTDIFLVDAMGELLQFYAASDAAFVGGSLITQGGGHNLLEPAMFELPIISGRYLHNFKAIADLFLEADALKIVHDEKELAEQVIKYLADIDLCKKTGERAKAVFLKNQGALQRHLELIEKVL